MVVLTRWVCVAVFALSVVAGTVAPSSALAAEQNAAKAAKTEKAKKAKKAKSPVQGYYAILVKQLKIEGDQLAQYTAAVAARAEALDAWQSQNEAKLAEAKKAIDDAKKANDKDAVKKARADAKALNAQRNALADEHRAKILAVLTPEQKTALTGYNLYVGAAIHFSKAKLTDEQKQRIRALCDESVKSASAQASADTEAPNATKKKLYETVEATVLTDEQRQQLPQPTKKPKKKPAENDK